MLDLILNISGCAAIIGNVFLLIVICFSEKDKAQDKATKVGFRFMQMLIILNVFAIGGNMLWQKI